MKKIRFPILFLLVSLLTSCFDSTSYEPKQLDPNTKYDDVYLIMGQSNASGVSQYNFLEASHPEVYQRYREGNSNVLMSYNTGFQVNNEFVPTKFGFGHTSEYFGPEIGIAEALTKLEKQSYIIKASEGATCLMTQYVNENGKKLKLYNKYVGFVIEEIKLLESMGKTPRVRGVFWMQGESDSFLDYSYKYDIAEQYFYEYLRHDLNNWIYDHFNFVDAYIHTNGICWVKPEVINQCKQNFCDKNENCYCIKTNGEDEDALNLKLKCDTNEDNDLAHYDSSSMLALGIKAGELLIK